MMSRRTSHRALGAALLALAVLSPGLARCAPAEAPRNRC